MQGKRARSVKELRKDAAARFLKLKRADEQEADFARRVGVALSTINNYTQQNSGLDLGILSRAAPYLTDEELLYVVTGREIGAPTEQDVAYTRGVRDTLAATKRALETAETELSKRPPASPEDVDALLRGAQAALTGEVAEARRALGHKHVQ